MSPIFTITRVPRYTITRVPLLSTISHNSQCCHHMDAVPSSYTMILRCLVQSNCYYPFPCCQCFLDSFFYHHVCILSASSFWKSHLCTHTCSFPRCGGHCGISWMSSIYKCQHRICVNALGLRKQADVNSNHIIPVVCWLVRLLLDRLQNHVTWCDVMWCDVMLPNVWCL